MAGKKERQRKLARERHLRQQTRRARRARRAQIAGAIGVAGIVIVGLGAGGYFLFKPGGTNAAATSATATPTPTASATPTPTASAVAEPATHCTYTSSLPAARNVGLPPATPASTATYQATIATNRGDVVIDLLNSKATCTVNSFVYLAAKNYFNNTKCHRLTTSGSLSVLQCGDPAGTGSGGPGYKFADENLAGATYPEGTVAMANSGANTNGSQFFLVYKNSTLSPGYTPFGKVVSGLGIIQNVAKAGTDNSNGSGDGHPKESVVIERVTIKKT
ncbi:MAG: peptidyl-prolyl cis-trans isomerase [Streptosporangiaceae bacterium]|nr:peptidyl-prolyl cis-trans isomerase [Streptosporangiaceae bacterium]